MTHKKLQWHPAFQAAIQIELEEDARYLQFLKEHNLTEKPLQIDTLVVKLESGRRLKKSIGQIFKQYNIIEYKSPEDYISINDFYKVTGYVCVYQSATEKVQAILPEDLTMTFVSNHYPRELLKHLQERYGAVIEHPYTGIYYVKGLLFPTQVVISGQLSAKEYTWLSRMRTDLKIKEDIRPLAEAYKGKEKNPMYEAVMDLIVRANEEQYKEEKSMCDALRELFADELEEREAKGKAEGEAKGKAEGKAESILELLADLGTVPEELKQVIFAQTKYELLNIWLKLAARANSIEEFIEKSNK